MSLADKSSLLFIPSGYIAQKVYSIFPTNGVGDFTFSRSGSATRIAKNGLITTVDSNIPRLNYPLIDGVVSGCPSLLLEPTKQNVLQRSEEFDNAYWVNNGVTITANQIISPDGTQNADLLTGVSGGFGVVRFSTWTSTNKVASCFAKKGSTNLFKIANASSGVGGVTFNVESGIITNTASGFEGEIENYGNGWFRCTAIDTSARSGTFSLGVTSASESVYIWGAQLESDYKTSYIQTTTTAVTRSAETANGAGDADTFNDSEGVLMVEMSALADDLSERRFSLNNGAATNVVRIGYTSASNRIIGVVYNGSNQAILTYNASDITANNKIALKYKENDFALWVNGIEVATDTSGATFSEGTLTNINFDSGSGGNDFYGKTKQIQYYNSALTDTELQALTS